MDLAQAATDVLAPLGFEVLELTVSHKGKNMRLVLRIDRLDERQVSVEDVTLAAEVFGLELDRLDPFSNPYQLELESPGPKRPLLKARHFERFHDLLAKVKTRQETFKGIIRNVQDDYVTFEVGQEIRTVALKDIETARLAQWPETPR